MTWHWRKSAACDLDELMDDINPQMKDLEGELQNSRPAIMAGYPRAMGSIVDQASVSHTGDLVETTLKTFDFLRGSITQKGGFKLEAAGVCSGTASTKTLKLKWGGETLLTLSVQAGNDKHWAIFAEIWNIDSTQEQRYLIRAWDGITLEQLINSEISVDTL